jgi:hypothetical protein
VVVIVVGYTTTYVISAYHHTRCEFESHPCEVYSMQQYVIKFVSDLRQVGQVIWGLWFSDNICMHTDLRRVWRYQRDNQNKIDLFHIVFPSILFLPNNHLHSWIGATLFLGTVKITSSGTQIIGQKLVLTIKCNIDMIAAICESSVASMCVMATECWCTYCTNSPILLPRYSASEWRYSARQN